MKIKTRATKVEFRSLLQIKVISDPEDAGTIVEIHGQDPRVKGFQTTIDEYSLASKNASQLNPNILFVKGNNDISKPKTSVSSPGVWALVNVLPFLMAKAGENIFGASRIQFSPNLITVQINKDDVIPGLEGDCQIVLEPGDSTINKICVDPSINGDQLIVIPYEHDTPGIDLKPLFTAIGRLYPKTTLAVGKTKGNLSAYELMLAE